MAIIYGSCQISIKKSQTEKPVIKIKCTLYIFLNELLSETKTEEMKIKVTSKKQKAN